MSLLQRIDGSKKIALRDFDPASSAGLGKEEGEQRTAHLEDELRELQELLYAAQETPVLIVLQGLDTSGKDGTISHVMSSMNPQSCRVASFKVPTPLEMAHDFLWRVHSEVPGKGGIVIFNRSHYEDVLVVRVHKKIDRAECRRRYEHINAFERLLGESNTIVLKFFLHIDKDEQEQRLIERERDPLKSWKLSPADWAERKLWDDYQGAYEEAINHCATPEAPWFVVPANHKWFRNLAIADTIVRALRPHRDQWLAHLSEIGAEALKELRAQRQSH
ncbi:MAG TPA: PPK2 family polyphosphate kinase [Chthonomonadaceae bacterium]|nr:PPK2 family polyphosphate kinase [Chthonomonadaceae bacterium]